MPAMSLNVQAFPLGSGPVPDPNSSSSAPTPPSSLTNNSPISESVATPVSLTDKLAATNLKQQNHHPHHLSLNKNQPPSSVSSPGPETPPGSPPLESDRELEQDQTTCTNSTDTNAVSSTSGSELSSASSSLSSATSVSSQPEIFSLQQNPAFPANVSSPGPTQDSDPFSSSSSAVATPTAISSARASIAQSPSKNASQGAKFPITNSINTNHSDNDCLSSNINTTNNSNHHITENEDVNNSSVRSDSIASILSASYPEDHPLYAPESLSHLAVSNPPVFNISATTLAHAIDHHYSSLLPEIESVFPWLHGLHQNNMSQRMFFQPERKMNSNYFAMPSFESLQASETAFQMPSNARGFLIVKVGPPNSQGTLIGSVYPDEILTRRSTDTDFDMDDFSFSDSADPALDPFAFTSEMYNSLGGEVDSSLNPASYAPKFINADPTEGISLRNFHIQVAKWATISDIALYVSDEALRPNMRSFALLISRAQKAVQKANPGLPQFCTFVVEDPIEKFLQESRHIMAVPPVGTPYNEDQIKMRNWDSNFLLHENVEMSMMSSASPIGGDRDNVSRVWLGNVADYESHSESVWNYTWESDKHSEDADRDSFLPKNGSDYDTDMMDLNSSDFSLHKALKTNWTLYIRCKPGAQMPSLSILDDQIRKTLAGDLEHVSGTCPIEDSPSNLAGSTNKWHKTLIEFPSSGTITAGTITESDVYTIISMCKLLYVRGRGLHKRRQTSSLIFCTDGYTESSILALCYVIYSKGLTAPQAWIYIHRHCYRPIFSFPTDPQLIFKLQNALLQYSPAVAGSLYDENYGAVYNIGALPETRVGNTYKPQVLTDTSTGSFDDKAPGKQSNELLFEEDPDPKPITHDDLPPEDHWFASFDGSFPSLILQHMYLGSLAHANNVQMLTRLGIKRVISVGERLNWVNYHTDTSGDEYMDDAETPEGKRAQIIENPYPGISKVLYISGVQDDGIDSLTEFLWACLDFLDEGELAKEPTLVHCRVGVSRSATVCIAEVMKRLSVGLPRAYLFVRVRRLNVIIQPHLRFMFELAKWEERHRRSGKGWLREVDWPILCREISIMNRAYIPS